MSGRLGHGAGYRLHSPAAGKYMSAPSRRGQVITFYSYKGGTGRTMALANVACLLAKRGAGNVLMIDWDLEAPGLHRFFSDQLVDASGKLWHRGLDTQLGLLDLFRDLDQRIDGSQYGEDEAAELLKSVDLDRYIMRCAVPSLSLMKAGRFDNDYSTSVNTFAWDRLYEHAPWLFKSFVDRLTDRFAYVLVDSRTGLTDSSGICTMLLPEKLVVVFTPNTQSLTGIVELIQRATTYRAESEDLRPLIVFPLASRIEMSEEELRRQWRYGGEGETVQGY
jgi:eukaryotic-like serine/threonine-protein kinase